MPMTTTCQSPFAHDQVLSFLTGLSRSFGVNLNVPECGAQCQSQVNKDRRTFSSQVIIDADDPDDEEFIISPNDLNKDVVNAVRSHAGLFPDQAISGSDPVVKAMKVFQAPVAFPQDLHFTVPTTLVEGQTSVCIEGPHGPIMVKLPEDAKPGEQRTWRLGPAGKQVVVPEGLHSGSVIDCDVEGVIIQATIPDDKAPGDFFEVLPPSLVVMIPSGSLPGDILEFPGPQGHPVQVPAPVGLAPGQYFTLLL